MKKIIYFVLALCISFASCKKDSNTTCPTFNSTIASGDVIVLNQGSYGNGNASITLYNPSTKTTTADLFNAANCRALGDVAQSMIVHNGKGYIALNNSGKIEVVDISTFKSVGTISGLGNPEYILPLSGSKAYVTDLYSGKINIIDLDAYTVTGSITIGGGSLQMAIANSKVYVLNFDSNFDTSWVQMIDPATDTKTITIALNLRGAVGMAKDTFGKLWVLCSKYDSTYSTPTGLVKVNTATNSVDTAYSYPIHQTGFSLTTITASPDGRTLCYIGSAGIYKMNATDNQVPATPFLIAGSHNYYGIGIDSSGQKLYAGDAGGFSSNGKAYSFNITTGVQVDSISTGIAPCFFIFK